MPDSPTADKPLWRSRLRAYGAALLLSAAAIGVLPETRPVAPVAIVRTTNRRRSPFDPMEQLGGSVVTVPLVVSEAASVPGARTIHLN